MKPYIIKNVKGIGKGLFANKKFKEGELILKGDLSKLKSYSSAEVKKLPNTNHLDYVGRGRYVNTNDPTSVAFKYPINIAVSEVGL